jgi:hypothetical protein
MANYCDDFVTTFQNDPGYVGADIIILDGPHRILGTSTPIAIPIPQHHEATETSWVPEKLRADDFGPLPLVAADPA